MKRREFLALASGAAAWPVAVRAQQPITIKRIAIAHPSINVSELSITSEHRGYRTLFEELGRLGYLEAHTLFVERFSGEGKAEQYADLAHDVVRTNPDLIIAIVDPLAVRFKEATATIPLITVTGDPVALGLVTTFARPGGNITGISADAGQDIWGKRLSLLLEATQKSSNARFLCLRSVWEMATGDAVREAAKRLGIPLSGMVLDEAIDESKIRSAFTTMGQDRVDALMVSDSAELFPHRQLIVELAARGRIPAVYSHRYFVESGGLMTYAVDLADMYRHVAGQIDKILKGADPGDIPIYRANRYEFIVNLKAAKALGLELPATLVGRADEVIE
jgi:putative ABC transport system substrate-binding protein